MSSEIDYKKSFINIGKGILGGLYQAIMVIIIPVFTFRYLLDISVAGIDLGLSKEKVELIMFYAIHLGLILVALAFFSASSPKRSMRKAIVNVVKIFINLVYIWAYKFSGAMVLTFQFVGDQNASGSAMVDVSFMATMMMGSLFLNIILAILDIIDWGFLEKHNKQKEAEKYKSKVKAKMDDSDEKKPLVLPETKRPTGVTRAEEITLSSKPELDKLAPVDDDFLSQPIDSFSKPKNDEVNLDEVDFEEEDDNE